MDHSQHSIHNHDHHVMHLDTHAGLDASGSVLSTTPSPMETMISHDPTSMHNHHTVEAHGGGDDTMSMMHHMMSMSFHFGCNETILFSWWKIDTVLGLIGSMVAIFVLAVLYEGLKYYREYLFWKTYNLLEYRPVTGPTPRNPESPQRPTPTTSASPVHPTMLSLNHLFQTLLHIIQVTLSFMLMLIFMTYNVWLCMAVVLGAAVGYFLFCWKKSVIVDVTEHCH